MRIAIQPDDYGPGDSSSPIWTELLTKAGHEIRTVNVYRADIIEQLRGCDGFMWRFAHFPGMRQIAERLLPVVENEMRLVVYPDQNTCWYYDDKIAQAHLFNLLGIPAPRTWVWFDEQLAKEFADCARYPMVMKLATGAGARNVMLLKSAREARVWIRRIFRRGLTKLAGPKRSSVSELKAMLKKLLGRDSMDASWEVHRGYALFQEFLPDNAYDTRVTVIGDRAFGFRRFNRHGDFRASGSGLIDHDPAGVAPEFIRLAFDTARKLRAQSCAIDGLWRGAQAVVGEVSYTYVNAAVHKCPGHWDHELTWLSGPMRPEEAQIADFLRRLESASRA